MAGVEGGREVAGQTATTIWSPSSRAVTAPGASLRPLRKVPLLLTSHSAGPLLRLLANSRQCARETRPSAISTNMEGVWGWGPSRTASGREAGKEREARSIESPPRPMHTMGPRSMT